MPPLPRGPYARLPRAFAPVVLVVLVVVVVLALSGCGKGSTPRTSSTAKPTPISQLNTSAMTLARVDFCALLPDTDVRKALGGGLGNYVSWRKGETALIDTDTQDAADEYGCAWTRGQNGAAAWIYARPITTEFAQAVLDKTSHREDCTPSTGPEFGTPHQQQTCTLPDGSKRVRLAGLFKDTYLTCQVQAPADEEQELADRTNAWCVQVANATNIAH